jgi:hypothetical protein
MAASISVIVPADAIAQIEDGIDGEAVGRKIDTTIAIAFYQQALQDALALLQPPQST